MHAFKKLGLLEANKTVAKCDNWVSMIMFEMMLAM
jgi:hypothetical protein